MGKVVKLPNGDLIYPVYRSGQVKKLPGELYGSGFYRSTDGGKTWGDFELAFRDNPPAGEKPYSFNESAFLVRDDGMIVGFARLDSRPDHGMFRIISTDNGKTWSVLRLCGDRSNAPDRIKSCSPRQAAFWPFKKKEYFL